MILLPPVAPLERFFIGTYTSPGERQGIFSAELDPATGAISDLKLAATAADPSFLAIHPKSARLYAVHEQSEGSVSAYAILRDGTLRLLNTRPSEGSAPCHVSVTSSGDAIFVSNYGSGSFAAIPLESDGSLGPASVFFQNQDSSMRSDRQEGPHMHFMASAPDGRFVVACDLGTDEVLVRRTGPDGLKTALDSAFVEPGSGPRHAAFTADGRFLFVNNELSNTVSVFARLLSTGALLPHQQISTLEEDPLVQSATAEIQLHPNGKWLYVSNRGDDSIATFAVNDHFYLTRTGVTKTLRIPRGFSIDPSGRWLVVAGQESNSICAMAIDPSTGRLSAGPAAVSVGKPVCIAFAP